MKKQRSIDGGLSQGLEWSLPNGQSLIAFAVALGARPPRPRDSDEDAAARHAQRAGLVETAAQAVELRRGAKTR